MVCIMQINAPSVQQETGFVQICIFIWQKNEHRQESNCGCCCCCHLMPLPHCPTSGTSLSYLPAAAAGRWPPVGSLTQLSAFISINLLNVGPSDKMHVLLSPKNAKDAKTPRGEWEVSTIVEVPGPQHLAAINDETTSVSV